MNGTRTGARPVVVEVDDHPLRWHGPSGGDYLSRWFAAASQRSRLDLVGTSDDGSRQHYRVQSGAAFSDGSPVCGRDHARAIRTALTLPSLQRFLVDITAVRTQQDELVVDLRRPVPHLPRLLRSVDLAPVSACGQLSSGSYERACLVADDEYWFEPVNPGVPPVRVLVRHDVHDAPARFSCGEVDVTCATAFPLDRVTEFAKTGLLHTAPLAMHMCLEVVPGTTSAASKPSFRRRMLGALRYDRLVARCWHAVEAARPDYQVEAPPSTLGVGERLRLGYWDYYPNAVVAEEVAVQLTENLGVEVELVHVDFVTGSARFCDLLLALRGQLFDDPLCEFDMLDPGRRDPALAGLLRRISETPNDPAVHDDFRKAVRERCPVVPLLRLRGHWLQREGLSGCAWPSMDAVRFPRFAWGTR